MEEADKLKTAFVYPPGSRNLKECPKESLMLLAPSRDYWRTVWGGLNLKEVLVFIDNIIIFAPTLEQHESRL